MMQFYYCGDIVFFETQNSKTLEHEIEVSRNVMDSNNNETEVFIKTIPNMRVITIAQMDNDEFNNFLITNNLK